jgi:hypothetical protein
VGVIEAEQKEKGETFRNDRLIAVAAESRTHQGVRELADLPRRRSKRSSTSSFPITARRGNAFGLSAVSGRAARAGSSNRACVDSGRALGGVGRGSSGAQRLGPPAARDFGTLPALTQSRRFLLCCSLSA